MNLDLLVIYYCVFIHSRSVFLRSLLLYLFRIKTFFSFCNWHRCLALSVFLPRRDSRAEYVSRNIRLSVAQRLPE